MYALSLEPGPFSFKRQVAYQDGIGTPSPTEDPEGWEPLSPITVQGELLDDRTVDLECSLSLAKPVRVLSSSLFASILIRDNATADLHSRKFHTLSLDYH